MKKSLSIAFLSLTTYFSSISYASECHLDNCPDDIFPSFFKYLTLPELYNMGLTAKVIDSEVMKYIGSNHDNGFNDSAKNHVMIKNYVDNPFKTVDHFLSGERQLLKRVYGVTDLLKEDPEKFIKLVLHSIPHTPETIDSDLRTFHQNTFQIDNLTNSLPTYETSQQKLASVLIELLTWAQVGDQVWDQVWAQVWAQVWDQVRAQVWAQVWDQVWDQAWDQVWAQVGDQVWDQVRAQVGDQVRAQVWDQVWAQVGAQVWANEDLRHFKFAPAFEAGNLNEVLKPAIDYVFTVYQLGTLAMRHSEAFKTTQSDFAKFISDRINEEQARVILGRLDIPDSPEGNYLVDTQLKLIKRLIQVSE